MPTEWKTGDLILDLYRVKGVLGEGGMGRVYRVHHTGWNLDLAVKTPLAKHLTNKGKESFIREAETWVNLGLHPHTVSCYYVREIDELPRVFAECVEGGSLKDWIDEGKLYEGGIDAALERILDIAIQFAWGLHYAHERGLVHQDVKPGNVMMTPAGTAKVTDFGLAQARAVSVEFDLNETIDELNSDPSKSVIVRGSGALTPAYCSPEQKSRQPLTRKTDIWSWAASVLEMFTGGLQWQAGEYIEESLNSYLEEWEDGDGNESDGIPQMPKGLELLLRRCFKPSPQERPKSMIEIADNLKVIFQETIGKEYSKRYPESPKAVADSLNNQAVSLIDLGRKDEALKLWEEALSIQKQHPESTYNRGLIHWRLGQINDDQLLREMEQVKQSYSDNWVVDYLIGQVHLERDDIEAAISILSNIKDISILARKMVKRVLLFANERKHVARRFLRQFEANASFFSISADSKYILSGCGSAPLELWDIETGRLIRTFEDHSSLLSSVCFSPDGKYAFSGGMTYMQQWDIETGKFMRSFVGHADSVRSVCCSPDGKFALSGSYDGSIKLWDLAAGRCQRTFVDKYFEIGEDFRNIVTSVSFSPDGKYVLSGGGNYRLRLWDIETGQILRDFTGHRELITSICFSEDGKFVLSGSADNTLKLWEFERSQMLPSSDLHDNEWDTSIDQSLQTFKGHNKSVSSVSFSPDGKYVLSGSEDETLKLWDIETGQCLRTFKGHTYHVSSVGFIAGGKVALSGGSGTLKFWNIVQNTYSADLAVCQIMDTTTAIEEEITAQNKLAMAEQSFSASHFVDTAIYTREARSISGYKNNPKAIELWTKLYLYLVRKSPVSVWNQSTIISNTASLCFSPDGQYVLSGSWHGGRLKLWDVKTGDCLRTFEGHLNRGSYSDYPDSEEVHSVCFSPDGKFALSGSKWEIRLWDIESGKCLQTVITGNYHTPSEYILCEVASVTFHPKGEFALSGDYSGSAESGRNYTLRLWHLETGKCLRFFEGHTSGVNTVSFSPDGKYVLSGSWDETLKLWDIETGQCLRTFEGHNSGIYTVHFSPDGKYVLSGSDDKTLKLWDVKTGDCLRTFEGHRDYLHSVSFSPDGKFALSGSYDGRMKLWDIKTGQCLRTLEDHTGLVASVCFSPDGKFIVSCDGKTIKLRFLDWELEETEPVDWDENARPYLQNFLTLYTPYAGEIPADRELTEEEIKLALTRNGIPQWNEMDFEKLLYQLSCAGFGYLKQEGVRHELENMVRELPSRISEATVNENEKACDLEMKIVNILLKKTSDNQYFGRVDDEKLFEEADFFLAIKTPLTEAELEQTVPTCPGRFGPRDKKWLLLISSPEVMETALIAFLPGVSLTHVDSPPLEISMQSGYAYYQIEGYGPYWEGIIASKEFAIYVNDQIAGVEFNLFAIKKQILKNEINCENLPSLRINNNIKPSQNYRQEASETREKYQFTVDDILGSDFKRNLLLSQDKLNDQQRKDVGLGNNERISDEITITELSQREIQSDLKLTKTNQLKKILYIGFGLISVSLLIFLYFKGMDGTCVLPLILIISFICWTQVLKIDMK